jgi:hypothetical protein
VTTRELTRGYPQCPSSLIERFVNTDAHAEIPGEVRMNIEVRLTLGDTSPRQIHDRFVDRVQVENQRLPLSQGDPGTPNRLSRNR